MATQSFNEILEIDTPAKAEKLAEAFKDADLRGPYVPESDVLEELERGRRHIRSLSR